MAYQLPLARASFCRQGPIVRFLPLFGKGEADVDFYDTLVVDRLLMVVVERNGLGVIEHVLAVVVLLGGDGVIDDLEVAALAFDFVGDGFDVVPDAPHRGNDTCIQPIRSSRTCRRLGCTRDRW